jgi:hypothetical protein
LTKYRIWVQQQLLLYIVLWMIFWFADGTDISLGTSLYEYAWPMHLHFHVKLQLPIALRMSKEQYHNGCLVKAWGIGGAMGVYIV